MLTSKSLICTVALAQPYDHFQHLLPLLGRDNRVEKVDKNDSKVKLKLWQ